MTILVAGSSDPNTNSSIRVWGVLGSPQQAGRKEGPMHTWRAGARRWRRAAAVAQSSPPKARKERKGRREGGRWKEGEREGGGGEAGGWRIAAAGRH